MPIGRRFGQLETCRWPHGLDLASGEVATGKQAWCSGGQSPASILASCLPARRPPTPRLHEALEVDRGVLAAEQDAPLPHSSVAAKRPGVTGNQTSYGIRTVTSPATST